LCNLFIPQYLLKKSTLGNKKLEYTFVVGAITDFNYMVTRNINVFDNKNCDFISYENDIKTTDNKPTNLDRIISNVRNKLSPYYPKKKILMCNEDELWGY
jgi:hypothetical protein